MSRYERLRTTDADRDGVRCPENATMLPGFALAKGSITFHGKEGKEYAMPIEMSLMLVILLSRTYSIPLRLKKESLETGEQSSPL